MNHRTGWLLLLSLAIGGSLGRPAEAGGDDPGEIRRLEGHADKVTSLAPVGEGRLLSGGDDKTMRLWNLEMGKQLRVFEGHTNFVLSVAASADGRRALSGSGGEFRNGRFSPGSDKTMRLWDLETGKELRKFPQQAAPVWCVRFLPDGRRAVSVSGEGENALRLWDLESGREVRRIGGKHSGQGVAVSSDGKYVVAASAPPDLSVRIWELETGEEVRRLEGHQAVVRGADFSPDGTRILTGGGNFVSGGLDTSIRLWDAETGRELRRLDGHEQLVWCVAFSPDGRRALSGSVDGSVRLWDLETGEQLRRFDGHQVIENDPRVGERADVRAVLFLPGGSRAISAGHDKTIRVWDLKAEG
ncbi:MAG: WD40 repeat domain-containing protein [Pirellulales bacterium]